MPKKKCESCKKNVQIKHSGGIVYKPIENTKYHTQINCLSNQ